jgi:hypothetical protein
VFVTNIFARRFPIDRGAVKGCGRPEAGAFFIVTRGFASRFRRWLLGPLSVALFHSLRRVWRRAAVAALRPPSVAGLSSSRTSAPQAARSDAGPAGHLS